MVVRVTNKKIITQIVYSTLAGDKVMAEAHSTELTKYGMTAGQTSYPAAYATGLLLARRILKKLKLDKHYEGNDKVDGKDYNVSVNPSCNFKPFTVILDIGLRRPTVGARVFGAMKGASDGGLNVPHSVKKFPGFTKKGKEYDGVKARADKYIPEEHLDRIMGVHIDGYMKVLKEKSEEAYTKQFSQWDKCLKNNGVESVEDMMQKVFKAIRENPDKDASDKKSYKPTFANDDKTLVKTKKGQYKRNVKLTKEQRDQNLAKKIETIKEQIQKLESAA